MFSSIDSLNKKYKDVNKKLISKYIPLLTVKRGAVVGHYKKNKGVNKRLISMCIPLLTV